MSENTFVGFVVKMNSKSGQGSRGPYTAYSGRLKSKDGEEFEQWFRFGFKKPAVEEGDYVKLTCKDVNDKFANVESYKVSNNPPKQAEAPAKGAAGGYKGAGGGSNYEAGRADRAYHAARGTAVELVAVLLENDALPVSANKQKAGAAKRFDEIIAAVDKLTVKFFRDEIADELPDFRLLATVADSGTIVREEPAPPVDPKLDEVPEEEEEEPEFDADDGDDDF